MTDDDMLETEPLLRAEDVDNMPVFPTIHMIRADVAHLIDTPLSYDALSAPDLTYTLVRPLSDKYILLQRAGNMSLVFALLLTRVHFLRDDHVLTASLSRTRAALCELVAIRCLRQYADNVLALVACATTAWPVYSGADPGVVARARSEYDGEGELDERVGNAIELAIISDAKRFLNSAPSQKVIDAIWTGRCVYQAASSHSFLSDTYKRNPVHFYNPHTAPVLDHYRLKVPVIRSVLEYTNFLILFILFIVCIELNEPATLNAYELVFMVYALGFSLEKVAAMQEHGVRVYFTGTWNGFDVAFVTLYVCYTFLSLYGIYGHHYNLRTLGIDCLALIAVLLFPRLAFVTLKNNLMVLSLRAMISQFFALMLIAVFCFGGFLYALWTFSRNGAGYSVSQIAWWMADLWFGLDASGFDRASEFNPVFGPIVMVTYACLSNTLLLTVLVSILSHTFSTITEDAAAEAMFRRAVSTIEGVKADSLFSYQPPINVFALCVLYPCSYVLSPRWFHKVNVFLIRVTNLPILVLISLYERQATLVGATGLAETISITLEIAVERMPRGWRRLVPTSLFEGMVRSGSDIDIIFEIDEEHNSALDMRDGPEMMYHRNPSPQPTASPTADAEAVPSPSARSPPIQQQHHQYQQQPTPSRPQAPPPARSGSQQTTLPLPLIPGRHRLTSLLHEGADVARQAASPLAQIFGAPIVVPEEPTPPVPAAVPTPPHHDTTGLGLGLGLGLTPGGEPYPYPHTPTSRRRRLSSASGLVRWPSDHPHAHGAPFRRFPTTSSVGANGGLSASPEDVRNPPPPSAMPPLATSFEEGRGVEPKAAEEAEEEVASVTNVELARRLDEMERRQQRIEEMLGEVLRVVGR